MPGSSAEGKREALDWIQELGAKSFLDVGTGMGNWALLLRRNLLYPISVAGIEVWEPYVERFHLRDLYTELMVGDARATLPYLSGRKARYDVVIFGDVLEHVTKDEAKAMWYEALNIAALGVILSIPTCHYPQGPEEGNPHEAHVKDDWTVDEVLETFPGIDTWKVGTEVSVFLAKTW